jgi:hypothetical protein
MSTVVHTPWDSYVAEGDDGPMAVSFDLEAAQDDLTGTLQTCLAVQIPIHKPHKRTGAPDEKEAARLWQLEDQLCEALAKNDVSARFVARLTHGGLRELVFQLDDIGAFGSVLQDWLANVKDYKVEFEKHEGWEFFNDMVRPGPEEWIAILDRRVMDSLLEAGTNPEKPHRIEYVFQGELAALQALAQGLVERGYQQVSAPNPETQEMVYALELPLDLEQIVEQSIANDALAAEHGARCDGWSAEIVE